MTSLPISRNSTFYSDIDFQLETSLLESYIEDDLGQTVILYEVDRRTTNTDSLYKETEMIHYKAPREIPCQYVIENSQLQSYEAKSSNGVYAISGELKFYVLTRTLEKYHCDIRRGDYVAIQKDEDKLSYFTVTDDGKINNANNLHVGAYKTAWRMVTCAPVTTAEFQAK